MKNGVCRVSKLESRVSSGSRVQRLGSERERLKVCKSERSRGRRQIRNYVKGRNSSEISAFYCLLGNEINTQSTVGNVSGEYRGKVSLSTKGINPQVCCSGQNVGPASGAAGLASRR